MSGKKIRVLPESPKNGKGAIHKTPGGECCYHLATAMPLRFNETENGEETGRMFEINCGIEVCCWCTPSPVKVTYVGPVEDGHGPNVQYVNGPVKVYESEQKPSAKIADKGSGLYIPDYIAEKILAEKRGGHA